MKTPHPALAALLLSVLFLAACTPPATPTAVPEPTSAPTTVSRQH